MPRLRERKEPINKISGRKRKPLPLKSVIRILLDQRSNHTNRIKEIDEKITEALRNDSTTPAYAWLQIIQTAINRSTVNFENTRLEYINPDQVPIIVIQRDKVNLIEPSEQIDSPPIKPDVSQTVVRIIADSRDSQSSTDSPPDLEEIVTTIVSTSPVSEPNQINEFEDPLEWNTPDSHESIYSDSFPPLLDPILTSIHPSVISEEIRDCLNSPSDYDQEPTTQREYITL